MNFIESDYLPFMAGELPPGPWLILAPHPDDETFGMGGSIRRAVTSGLEVYVVVLTDGALGGPDPSILVPTRESEAREAARILGIQRIEFWREPDRQLKPGPKLIHMLAMRMLDLRIGTLFFPSLTEPHPDHRATTVIGWEACRLAAFSGDIIGYEISSHGPINLLLDISQQIADKEAAMAVYTSQEAERPYSRRVLAHNVARTWSLADEVLYAESFLRIPPSDTPLSEIASSFFHIYPSGLVWQDAHADLVSSSHNQALDSSDQFEDGLPVSLLLFHPSDTFGGAERITGSIMRLHNRHHLRIILVASPLLFPKNDADQFISLIGLGLSNGFSTLRRAYQDACLLSRIARQEGCTVALGMLHYGAFVVALMRFISGFRIHVISSPRTPSRLGIEFHVGHTGKLAFIWRTIVRFFCRFASRIIVASEGLRRECIDVYGSKSSKVLVIPNGIDTERLRDATLAKPTTRPTSEKFRIITFCRLSPEKDLDTLLAAFAVARQQVNASLMILGDGPERQRLEILAETLNISDHVTFMGFHAEPFSLIKTADAFVHTARFEGFGNAILEAMACGVPVIATDCDFGPREIVQEGVNGMLVPPQEPLRLAEAIITMSQDGERHKAYVRKGYETLKRYQEKDMVIAYERVILSLGQSSKMTRQIIRQMPRLKRTNQ